MSIEAWARSAFGAHYSRLYRHRDDDEARRAVALVDRIAGLDGARVLDLGCGAGRHLGPLAGSGACVVGMDQSPELLSEAHDEVPEAAGSTLVRGIGVGCRSQRMPLMSSSRCSPRSAMVNIPALNKA